VNGTPVTREELMEWCLAKYGSRELEPLVASKLLKQACERRDISVTDAECEAEAARVAQSFGLSSSDWYRTLLEQRGITKDNYLRDIVAMNLMLKKLGADSSSISGLEGLKRTVKKLAGRAEIEVYWSQPASRPEPGIKLTPQSQEDRLKAVEQSLEQILKTLDGLKRPAEDARR